MEKILAWRPLVQEIAPLYGLPVSFVLAIIRIESNGNAGAINPKSQATGLMQVLPAESTPPEWNRPWKADLLKPSVNIEWGCRIAKYFRNMHNGDLKMAMYSYSGGSHWSSQERYEAMYWRPLVAAQEEIERLMRAPTSSGWAARVRRWVRGHRPR